MITLLLCLRPKPIPPFLIFYYVSNKIDFCKSVVTIFIKGIS